VWAAPIASGSAAQLAASPANVDEIAVGDTSVFFTAWTAGVVMKVAKL